MGLNNDGRRGLDVLQALMNPEHPYSQFSVGSLESLADRPEAPMRAELIEFYERYYKAGNMRLVVLGKSHSTRSRQQRSPLFQRCRRVKLNTIF